jgi:hypothetical protein
MAQNCLENVYEYICVHNSFMIAERINTPVYLTHNQIFKIKTC